MVSLKTWFAARLAQTIQRTPNTISQRSCFFFGHHLLFQQEMKTTFEASHVEYIQGDYISLIISLCSLLPFVFVIMNFSVLLVKRDVFWIHSLIGAFLCAGLNEILKEIIQGERPLGSAKSGYGMPSNHSQLAFFYVTIVLYYVNIRITISDKSNKQFWSTFISLIAISAGSFVAYSRVQAGVHSNKQVIVGAIVGSLFSVFWLAFYFTSTFQSFLQYFLHSFVAKYFYIYESSRVKNPLQFDFENYTAYRIMSDKRGKSKITS